MPYVQKIDYRSRTNDINFGGLTASGLNALLYDVKRPVVSQMDHAERQEIRPQRQN